MNALFHCIVGLPRSGKTTFLAALWHIVDAGEIDTRLTLDRLVGDHSYLNSIVEKWRRCEEVQRTSSLAAESRVTMHLKDSLTGQQISLHFPDLAGEAFESQFALRTCRSDYVDGYAKDGGILLFVNADRGQDGMTILDLGPALGGHDEPLHSLGPESRSEASSAVHEWAPSLVPEQVRLVDLLQFLLRPPFKRRRRRIAVAISAWDVVADIGLAPTDWLAREMPLLHQFLRNNPDSFEYRAYGISAQGGVVKGPQRTDLLKATPSRRVRCIGQDTSGHDLTDPLVWLGGDR